MCVIAQYLCFACSVWAPPASSPHTGCLRRRECLSATSASSAPPSSTRSMVKRASCMFAPQNAPREVGEYQWKDSTHSLINKYKRVGPVGKCSSKTTAGGGDDQETLQKHSVRPVRSVNSSLKRRYRRSHKTRDIKSKKVMRRYRASVCVSAPRAATGSISSK